MTSVVALAGLLGLAALLVGWRRHFLRPRPLRAWGREYATPTEAVEAAAQATGLHAEALRPGWEWLVDLAISPVWFFWGDIRTRRPARQLRRFSLVGPRGPRTARVRFGDDDVTLELDGEPLPALWAEPASRRAYVDQEGLRPLLPVGSPRWLAGTALLDRAFAAGATRVITEGPFLRAELRPIDATAPDRWPPLLDTLAELGDTLHPHNTSE